MLTSQHAIIEYEAGRAKPDRLVTSAHRHYLDYARKMLEIYRSGSGLQRRQLHRKIEAIFAKEADCPLRRIQSFCKLLDDRSTYDADERGQAAQLRLRVFSLAGRLHPLVTQSDRLFEHDEAEAKTAIASTLGMDWRAIEQLLYADVLPLQKLNAFEGDVDPAALLSRYNVAQLQACLYRAERMTIHAGGDFKTILRYAKLARLLHEITPLSPCRYRISLSGPASILRQTHSYGVNFARFLPALLACKDWSMSAVLRTPWEKVVRLNLSDRDGFKSHLPSPSEFDSTVEEAFAAKFGDYRNGWQLFREGEILHSGQQAFVPDFLFRHDDGTTVLMEIVAFWTPQYLQAKRRTLQKFSGRNILIALPQRMAKPQVEIGPNVILYKTALTTRAVLDALERCRLCGTGASACADTA